MSLPIGKVVVHWGMLSYKGVWFLERLVQVCGTEGGCHLSEFGRNSEWGGTSNWDYQTGLGAIWQLKEHFKSEWGSCCLLLCIRRNKVKTIQLSFELKMTCLMPTEAFQMESPSEQTGCWKQNQSLNCMCQKVLPSRKRSHHGRTERVAHNKLGFENLKRYMKGPKGGTFCSTQPVWNQKDLSIRNKDACSYLSGLVNSLL